MVDGESTNNDGEIEPNNSEEDITDQIVIYFKEPVIIGIASIVLLTMVFFAFTGTISPIVQVDGQSMEPTLNSGDRLLASSPDKIDRTFVASNVSGTKMAQYNITTVDGDADENEIVIDVGELNESYHGDVYAAVEMNIVTAALDNKHDSVTPSHNGDLGEGDIIVFEMSNRRVIHRADAYVLEGQKWYDHPHVDRDAVALDVSCREALRCPVGKSGFVTNGENTPGYDQPSADFIREDKISHVIQRKLV